MIEFERVTGKENVGTLPVPRGDYVRGRLAMVEIIDFNYEGLPADAAAAMVGLEVEVMLDCEPASLHVSPGDAAIYVDALEKALLDSNLPEAAAAWKRMEDAIYFPLGKGNYNFTVLEPHEFKEL